MDWNDYFFKALDDLFEEYHWCIDDVEEVMNNDENFDPVNDTSSESASSSSAEDDERYRYEHYEDVYFSDERSWF